MRLSLTRLLAVPQTHQSIMPSWMSVDAVHWIVGTPFDRAIKLAGTVRYIPVSGARKAGYTPQVYHTLTTVDLDLLCCAVLFMRVRGDRKSPAVLGERSWPSNEQHFGHPECPMSHPIPYQIGSAWKIKGLEPYDKQPASSSWNAAWPAKKWHIARSRHYWDETSMVTVRQ